jgi:hypothetical protein
MLAISSPPNNKKIINNITLKLIYRKYVVTSIDRKELIPNVRVLEKYITPIIS